MVSNTEDTNINQGLRYVLSKFSETGEMTGCVKCEASSDLNALASIVTSLMHQLQLINKIQLPKLNNDIAYLKVITERIVSQNEKILTNFDKSRSKEVKFRCRNLELSPQRQSGKLGNERGEGPKESTGEQSKSKGERSVGRRTRRRLRRGKTYPLRNMFIVMLNRSFHTRSKKRKN
ncbi:unnamed protein product [Pieris macdunnoughi]|uniref:Uncharacterized protein n=1 Tax=Pieris macdunnoughi TaxID=345717 RepID=A0A821LI51_9NEOP|nr:unnamed protein product [Pieris macdunnoughi]